MTGYHKVPFREVYCDTWLGWAWHTFRCLVVLRFVRNPLPPAK